jgi:TorA maturation chaperone TorD
MSAPDQGGSHATLAPEDALRAELYGLLAHLFAAGPGADLLKSVAASPVEFGAEGDLLGSAWRGLKAASGAADAAALEVEHAELFVGTGKARVSIYASHYLSDTWKEHTLVELRDELQALGLGRQAGVTQPEDHLAALLDVMRHLAGRGDDPESLVVQQRFFERYLGPWFLRFGADVESVADALFYRAAAKMLMAFCEVEQHAFALEH